MNPPVRVLRDVSLQTRNTFGVSARATLLAEVNDAAHLPELLAGPAFRGTSPLVIGGGSNLLFVNNPQDPLLALTGGKVELLREENGTAVLRADAGTAWHVLVMKSLALGLSGLENLALIPGSAGAAPIQNIGAYGVEVREFIACVEAFEPGTGQWHRMDRDRCAFGYRDSVFKQQSGRFIVTAVEFALPRQFNARLGYAGIGAQLTTMGISDPTAAEVAEAVIAIRRSKLPDPAVIGNAGSFFKNPVVTSTVADALLASHPAMPSFAAGADADRKLSAAWLIDACGWKGHRQGDAGVSAGHALVLVNHGTASGQQLLDLARQIADSVHARFGVALEPEPRVVGAHW
ncbi:MAG: UDP-N-acetylmuramate dehydrogenase [Lysobacter sp.]